MKSKLPEFLDSYVIISLSKKDFSARDKQRSPSWDFSDLGITRQEEKIMVGKEYLSYLSNMGYKYTKSDILFITINEQVRDFA